MVRRLYTMTEVSVNPGIVPISFDVEDSDIFTSSRSAAGKPEPNPAFVFPMQPSRDERIRSDEEDPANRNRTTNRRSHARAKPQRISTSAPLPAFDFHPSSADSVSAHGATPPESPMRSMAFPPRAAGHRRGGSEFIGGDGIVDGPGLMSTSPTKGEDVLPHPQLSRLGPSGARRGHAHRRSGAVSSHDISTISRPFDESTGRSGSAPTTPSDPSLQRPFLPNLDRSSSQPVLTSSQSVSDLYAPHDGATFSTGRSRPRVGFSDTLEFIPRPLSTISSETSSSLSTIRAAHSVTDSITSIVSGGTPSPPSAKKNRTFFESMTENSSMAPRPRTANAALEFSSSEEHLADNIEFTKRPSSAAASPDGFKGTNSTTISSEFASRLNNGANWSVNPQDTSINEDNQISGPRSFPSSEDMLKFSTSKGFRSSTGVTKPSQRNPNKWAGGILSRKSKPQVTTDRPVTPRSPSAAVRSSTPVDELSLDDVNFDEDNTCVIRDPQHVPLPAAKIDYSSWKPRLSAPPMDSDMSSSMLDLDAALGPFNTPDNANMSGFSSARRRMHSSGATGGFDGPGMHYHRRAESAPQMAPVQYGTFGLHRLGSDSTMADVFEEDEESEPASSESARFRDDVLHERTADNQADGLGVQIVDVDDGGNLPPERYRNGSKHQILDNVTEHDISTILPSGPAICLTASCETIEDTVPVEIVDGNEEPRFSVVTKSSDESTITPRLSIDPLAPRPHSAPLEFTFPTHTQPFNTPETASSAVSSPDCTSTSFDFPRLNTAHSSITDRTTWSSTRGCDLGKDHGYSADDVPSLTSSTSTMISAQPARLSSSAVTKPSSERASSYTATEPSRIRPTSTGKRSSLVSLSRLVGGSQGERSKLSIESHPQLDDTDKSEKKKGKRMSRLLRFWSPKARPKSPQS